MDNIPPPPSLTDSSQSWFKRPWFIILVILLLVLWFGPIIWFNFMSTNKVESNFTPASNLEATTDQKKVFTDIATSDDPWLGSPIAPVVIVEFGDFQCPFCRQAAPIIKQVLSLYPEAVKLIYRDFPVVSIHDQALPAAEAANCAFRQGGQSAFWQFYDSLYTQQENLSPELYRSLAAALKLDQTNFERCLNQHLTLAEIQADLSDGVSAGVRGTPTWFVNGRKIEGALTLDLWQQVIDSTLRREFRTKP